jgi:ATP-dependent DNA helicase RecQ
LNAIIFARPTTIPSLLQIPGVGPRIADIYGASVIALCRSDAPPNLLHSIDKKSSSRPNSERVKRVEEGVETPPQFSARTTSLQEPTETFTRPRSTNSEPADTLTPDQQALDQRLREWRKSESERLNLPLFFVLASTTLRSVVLARPQTLSQLKTIHGLGQEKIEKFGPGILEICTT